MKKMISILVIMLMAGLCFSNTVRAEQFQVSCVMPAIPGVNVPLIEEESVVSPQSSPAESQSPDQENTSREGSNPIIQQEDSEEIVLAQNNALVITHTIYSR